jgi:hypothetical protein
VTKNEQKVSSIVFKLMKSLGLHQKHFNESWAAGAAQLFF